MSHVAVVSRSERFGETAEEYRQLAAFSGEDVAARMDHVRDFIVEIRREILEPEAPLMAQAAAFVGGRSGPHPSAAFVTRLEALRTGAHGFADLRPEAVDHDYSAVWLYTSNEGYSGAFSAAKRSFRTADASPEDLRIATLLVELLTIDLYNYWYSNQRAATFEGWVWRGLWMTKRDFDDIERKRRAGDVRSRYRSIPLALDSASNDKDVALRFLETGAGDVPVLQRIWVHGLSDPSLSYYKTKFPSSPVSTICAVDISAISAFPRQGEVLLRGGFFQLLNVCPTTDRVRGKQVRVVEMVTMNTNRDHPATPQGPSGELARALIRSLVTAERTRYCVDYHREHGQPDDARLYAAALSDEEAAFRAQSGDEPPWAS